MSASWKRNLRVLSVGQLVAIAAMGIVMPLIPFFLRELGMTDRAQLERWSGLVFSGPFLAAALMSPVWGALGDRYGHKKMVVRAIVGLSAVNLLLVFVQSPEQFLAIRIAQGLITGFVPAALAITSSSTPVAHLPAAMGRLAASASAGRLLGPAIGGVLAGFLPFRQLFLIVGLTISAAAIYVAVKLEEPERDPAATRTSLIAPLRSVLAHRSLRLALPGLMFAMIGISMSMPIFPLYVEDLCGARLDPKLITGLGFAVVATFTLIASTLLGRISKRIGLKTLLIFSLALSALALALHPLAHSVGVMLPLRALLGIGVAGTGPVLHTMISRSAPEALRGGVTGLANSATILGFFVGPIVGGWLANVAGTGGVFRVAAALTFGSALAAALLTRRVGSRREIGAVIGEVPR